MSQSSIQPILALIGPTLSGNPTQYMIEKAMLHHRLEWHYLSLEVAPEDLADAVRGIRALGFTGGNCVGPLKDSIILYLDRSSPTAELTRAVNTFHREGDRLVGDNTEGLGCVEALRRRVDPAGKRVAVLGAGRMGRAVAVELALAHAAEIIVVDRDEPAGRQLAEMLGVKLGVASRAAVWDDTYALPEGIDVLVDATGPVEDPAEALPLGLEQLAAATVVADVSFNPARTWLLAEATKRGCPTVDGLEMFIEQTAANFRLWTGTDPDRTVLREAVEEFLEL